jgi:hypothetical protein
MNKNCSLARLLLDFKGYPGPCPRRTKKLEKEKRRSHIIKHHDSIKTERKSGHHMKSSHNTENKKFGFYCLFVLILDGGIVRMRGGKEGILGI